MKQDSTWQKIPWNKISKHKSLLADEVAEDIGVVEREVEDEG